GWPLCTYTSARTQVFFWASLPCSAIVFLPLVVADAIVANRGEPPVALKASNATLAPGFVAFGLTAALTVTCPPDTFTEPSVTLEAGLAPTVTLTVLEVAPTSVLGSA